jgi:histidine triad (HIT) family protein
MGNDFYCEEVFSGKTKVKAVLETKHVLAYYHTNPYCEVHIVVVPKKHIDSLLTLEDKEIWDDLLNVLKKVASQVKEEYGACRIITNLGQYQDSKHLHCHVAYGKVIKSN